MLQRILFILIVSLSLVLGISPLLPLPERAKGSDARSSPSDFPSCPTCVRIRVGLPWIVRGPAPDIADSNFTEIRLPNGVFRGFSAHQTTRAIDGMTPLAMGGKGVTVMGRGLPGSPASCGRWLQHVEPAGASLLGWVHNEGPCDIPIRQTHKSMSLATSSDYGMTWTDQGLIISGTDDPNPGMVTGEGDCTAVDGQEGYYYAYCKRPRDGATFVARAPISQPGPGKWLKYFEGSWSQPGLGGNASDLEFGPK